MIVAIAASALFAGLSVATSWGNGKEHAAIIAAGIGALVGILIGKFIGDMVVGKPPKD